MLITSERRDELRRMQALLYKCIAYMAEHYREWVPEYMPLDEKVMEILDRQSRYPFRAGAYRPDYLISEDGQLLLVEITSRFFGHGIWANYPSEAMAQQFMAAFPEVSWENRYNELLTYMRDIIPVDWPIYVLKSSDRGSESVFYTKFYEYYGHEVTVYEADQVEAHIDKWSHDAVVFSALNQQDLLSFKMETLQAMIDARMLNDFRTIFLIHDKRFLHLIFVDDFTRQCLTEEETTFLRQHTIPTYLAPQPPKGGGRVLHSADPVYYSRLKEYAQKNRNHPTEAESLLWSVLSGKGIDGVKFRRQHIIGQYIADFVCLDKGLVVELDGHHHSLPPFCEDDAVRTEYLNKEGYHVIRFTNEQVIHHLDDTLEQIRAALQTPPLGGRGAYILQPFIRQRTYPCVWAGKHYDEYVCGMMLCVDDCYFDSGVFRTSSAPVTNKVDDRKMCVIHSDDEELKKNCFVL
jgi:very-short-patch-repair endonuclease